MNLLKSDKIVKWSQKLGRLQWTLTDSFGWELKYLVTFPARLKLLILPVPLQYVGPPQNRCFCLWMLFLPSSHSHSFCLHTQSLGWTAWTLLKLFSRETQVLVERRRHHQQLWNASSEPSGVWYEIRTLWHIAMSFKERGDAAEALTQWGFL